MTDEVIWNRTTGSDNRMNRMTNIPNTGDYLAALDKTQHGLFICTADGTGLVKDNLYMCSADGTTLINVTATQQHNHSDTSTGGTLTRIMMGNEKVYDLMLTKATDLYEADWTAAKFWIRTVTSTGTVENKTDGSTGERSIRLRPNGTSGSGSTISYPHLKLDFAKDFIYQTKLQIETATSLALHSGVNCDDITAADSNTIKVNAEVCTATNNNWFLRTADGTNKSSSDTGIAITANRVAIKIKFFAGSVAQLFVDSGTLLEKTTNLPASGASASNNVIKHSVKNSTGADRPLLVYGSRLVYTISDNWV